MTGLKTTIKWSQESGDPEQIKAALEEAKRAGADEARRRGWKMDGVCIVLPSGKLT